MKKILMLTAAAAAAAFLTIGANARAESGADVNATGEKGAVKTAPAKKDGKKERKPTRVSPEMSDPKVKYWTWKREIKGVKLGNLAAPWNGSDVFFTITAPASEKTDKKAGDIIAAVGGDSKITGEMGGDTFVKSLYASGPGDDLMAEMKDGKFFAWPKWRLGADKGTAVDYPAGTVPSQTFKTAVFVDKAKKEATIYGQNGKKLRSYPLASIPASVPAAWSPFFKDEEFVLVISAEGEVTYYNREQKLWSLSLGAPAKAVASSYMKGELLAFGIGDGVVLVDANTGTLKGRLSFKNERQQLDCSQDAGFCAVIGSDAGGGGRLVAFSADGKELWSRKLEAKPRKSFLKVQALAKGSQVIAGLEEKNGPEVEAFDDKGGIIWRAPLGGGVLDYRVSWGGDAVAALYKDVITYYNFKPAEKKETAPLHPVEPLKKPGKKAKDAKKDAKKQAEPEPKKD